MNTNDAKIALAVLRVVWASLPKATQEKIKTWAYTEVRDVAVEEIKSFLDSLPHASPEPSTMDSIEAGHMLGNNGQEN